MDKKLIIVFVGPSGAGKGSIETLIFADQELNLEFSISATTRQKRDYEHQGVHYYFISKEQFQSDYQNGAFLETGSHFDNFYGTYKKEIERIHDLNKIPFLEIDTEGFKIMKRSLKSQNDDRYEILSFFIAPPSMCELKKRILMRNSESPETIKIRLAKASREMAQKEDFDFVIVNDEVEKAAYQVASKIKEVIRKLGNE